MTSIRADLDHLAPGSTVIIRDAEWLVTGMESAGDHWFLEVIGTAGLVRDQSATFYTGIDQATPLDPKHTRVTADTSPRFARSRLWLESMIRRTPIPTTTPELSVATDALVDALPYQEAAALQALDPDNLRPRILLADAVGLGKTIEIGMILAELARRGQGERILVVTPKHVLEQMQFELWTRFALPFIRLDSTGIQRIRQELPAGRNPFTYYKRVIISIDTLKSDQYIPHLRAQKWDAVVIDESHNVTNTATLNNRLAGILAENAHALILASATPHNGRKESFAELIRMLDPSAVSPAGDVDESALQHLVIRRHRHSPEVANVVGADWAERREPNNIPVPASEAENAVAAELERTWLWPEGSPPSASSLFPWTLAKAFLSSPAALEATVTERLRRIADDANGVRERTALERLLELTEESVRAPSAKYAELTRYLKDIGVGKNQARRAVIFAERVPTLKWLQEKLIEDFRLTGDQVAILHGGLSDVEQQEIVESFKLESSPIRILVTGDLASEGVNLHAQCHHLLHYDIPWSLIRIEQRNGRIDRYGQKHRPEITTLLLQPDTDRFAGDFRVLARLVEREHEAHTALGDAASLIGTYNVRAEEDEILKVIQQTKRLDDVVATPEQVKANTGPTGMLARIFASPAAAAPAPEVTPPAERRSLAGLFDSDHEFLDHAVYEVSPAPGSKPPQGMAWDPQQRHQITMFTPPPDLAQRLTVLPQSYQRARKVLESFKLATTKKRGERELVSARSADSTSAWPEAHYLSPLHPVLDWAADRVLAGLERGTIYAVHGNVDHPTVVLQGTLTNARGQVIAAAHHTASFMHHATPVITPHASAKEAFDAVGLATRNSAEISVAGLNDLIAPAVTAAESQMEFQIEAIKEQVTERVHTWVDRTRSWQEDATTLVQHQSLRRRSDTIEEEARLAADMLPERTLVRPLLVVVPEGSNV